jgi:8-oxo-dGTP pyrophosphatase MutT (NUDIX family)
MESKRKSSGLIPYKLKNGKVLVFLQKRTKDNKRLPGYFGFFGGAANSQEHPEETMLREIKEELTFTPKGFTYLGEYESDTDFPSLFVLKVSDDFEKQIKVLEGEYGKWFSEQGILDEPKIQDLDKRILQDFYKKFKV